nr:hypothetical protein L204_04882 [Cryptococcus depauperatus CBS 7855]
MFSGLYEAEEKLVYTDDSMRTSKDVWAPELHKLDGSWYIYFSQHEKVWALKGGEHPMDEYKGKPVQLLDKWGIDGTILQHGGNNYFVWSCHSKDYEEKYLDGASSICIAKLTSPTSIDKSRISVISSPTNDWEKVGGSINEAPAPLYWEGETYMTFSASHCVKAAYSLGLLHLRGDDPLDPKAWSKRTEGPVFSSANSEYGPGHNALFLSPDGKELWNVYHAVTTSEGSCGMDRQTFATKVDTSNFSTKGPIFGEPAKQGSKSQGPSGEKDDVASDKSSSTLETKTNSPSESATDTQTDKETKTSGDGKPSPTKTDGSITTTGHSLPPSFGQDTDANNGGKHTVTNDVNAVTGTSTTSQNEPTVSGGGLTCKVKRAKLAGNAFVQ